MAGVHPRNCEGKLSSRSAGSRRIDLARAKVLFGDDRTPVEVNKGDRIIIIIGGEGEAPVGAHGNTGGLRQNVRA